MYMDVKFADQVADKNHLNVNFCARRSALDGHRNNLYLAYMARNMTSFPVFFVRALISASLIACLTIAPICAARCATTLCIPASADNPVNDCHHSSHRSGSAPTFTTPSATPCSTADLIFTTPRLGASSVSIGSDVFSIAFPHLDLAMQSLGFGLCPRSAQTSLLSFSPPLPLRL